MTANRKRKDELPPGYFTNQWSHHRRAAAQAESRQLAALAAAAPRCAYHVGATLLAITQRRRVYAGTSPTGYTRQRTVLRCPVAGCVYVAALPGEMTEESTA